MAEADYRSKSQLRRTLERMIAEIAERIAK
jgi:hypothetical protein